MSEVNISAMAQAGESKIDNTMLSPMQEFNLALKDCKFGKFHIKLLTAIMFGIFSNLLVSMDTSYILPIAECDLEMDLARKGGLNAITYFGMLFSSIIAGFLTDTFGRKIFLQCGFGGIFLCTLIAGTSQTYHVLVTAKFFEGVLFASSFNAMVAMTSEFCHDGIRDRMMLCQSSFLAIAQIVIACFSWAVLTQEWHLSLWHGFLILNTWNFYLYICSLWSCTAFVLYTLLPESPKYLISQGKFEQAREILIGVYVENTGKPPETFRAWSLWRNESKVELSSLDQSLHQKIRSGLENLKPMFRKPLFLYIILVCVLNFFSMLIYNVIRLWFPQISTIIEHYKGVGDEPQEFCYILDAYTSDVKNKVSNDTICVPAGVFILIGITPIIIVRYSKLAISCSLLNRNSSWKESDGKYLLLVLTLEQQKSGEETYINSIILGLVCIAPYLVSGILVNKVGKKALMIAAGCAISCATFGIPWSGRKPVMVTLFSMDVALTQTTVSLIQTFVVEFFPTTVRSLAIGMMMTSGRLGTLVGNLLFPMFLTYGCNVLFFTLTGIMVGVTLMFFLLPNKKK